MLKSALLASALALVIGVPGASQEALAEELPWCAVVGGRNAFENCGYYTLNQCRAAVSGVGGDCKMNPRFTPGRHSFERSAPLPPAHSRR